MWTPEGAFVPAAPPSDAERRESEKRLRDAAASGAVWVVRTCLGQGVAVTADASGRTAVHHAAINGHKDVVELFVRRPWVNVTSRDNSHYSPLAWALLSDHMSVATLLLERCGCLETVLRPDVRSFVTPAMHALMARYTRCRRARLALVALRHWRRTPLLVVQDKNIVALIGRAVWALRTHAAWADTQRHYPSFH